MKYITVYFKYGSIPLKSQRLTGNTNSRIIGGMWGGHAAIHVDNIVFSFRKNNIRFPLFPKRGGNHGAFRKEFFRDWMHNEMNACQYVAIKIPVTISQYTELLYLANRYTESQPFDYAFFGHRCASACYHILAQIDVLQWHPRWLTILKNFCPRMLRNRVLKIAVKEQLPIAYHEGTTSRKWERPKLPKYSQLQFSII